MGALRFGSALAICAGLLAPPAAAAEFNLKFAHFYPPVNHHTGEMVPDWTKRIAAQSKGRIDIIQFPSGQLLKAPETFDGLKNGVADIGMVAPGLTPGRFLEASLVDLPFMFRDATSASRAMMELFEKGMFAKDFADVKVLYLSVIDMSTIHARNKPVGVPSDLKGLRIRFPTAAIKDLLAQNGAIPIGTPPAQIYESLERGVIDGYTGAWDSLRIFRLGELVKYSLDLPVYTLALCICMSRRSFDSLPAELQAAIMDNSGVKEAERIGASYDRAGKSAFEKIDRTKHFISKPTPEQEQAWRRSAEPIIEAQLKALEAKGVKARESYKLLRETAAKYEK